MQLSADVLHWLEHRKRTRNHRQLLVISGEQCWVNSAFKELLKADQPDSIFNLNGENADATNKSYKQALGKEFQYVVYDAFSGLRANALIALSGCVCKSGLMILLCPELSTWPDKPDPERHLRSSYQTNDTQQTSFFVTWLVQHILDDHSVCILSQSGFRQTIVPIDNIPPPCADPFCRTPDQQHVVDKILKTYSHPKMQMVITANRGRGKSSALGIAAGHLLCTTQSRIVVTAAHKSMTTNVFEQAERVINSIEVDLQRVQNTKQRIVFMAIDALLASDDEFDVILIDEAAIIPNQVLEELVERSARVIFSTTVQGYEGSGRGFELRFKPFLKQHYPKHATLTLEEPIRWYPNDALEAFWFKAMAMVSYNKQINADTQPGYPNVELSQLCHHKLSAEQLISDPALLNEVFSLLVDAHYQTSPDDLVRLLDASDQHVLTSYTSAGEIAAVALVNFEGGENTEDIAVDVSTGKRRVSGHLSAQKLAFALADPSLMTLRYLRIVRIAVKDKYRRQGIGSALLGYISDVAGELNCDFLSSSFGLTSKLLTFWQGNGFTVVYVGMKRDPASGEFSGLLLKAITPSQTTRLLNLQRFGLQELHFQKNYRLATLAADVWDKLPPLDCPTLTDNGEYTSYITYLQQFIMGSRPLHSVERQIYLWLSSLKNEEWLSTLKDDEWESTLKDEGWLSSLEDEEWLSTLKDDEWLSSLKDDGWVSSLKDDGWVSSLKDDGWVSTLKDDGWLSTLMDDGWVSTLKDDGWVSTLKDDGWVSSLGDVHKARIVLAYRFLHGLVIRRQSIEKVCAEYGLTGKKQVERCARGCVSVLLKQYLNE